MDAKQVNAELRETLAAARSRGSVPKASKPKSSLVNGGPRTRSGREAQAAAFIGDLLAPALSGGTLAGGFGPAVPMGNARLVLPERSTFAPLPAVLRGQAASEPRKVDVAAALAGRTLAPAPVVNPPLQPEPLAPARPFRDAEGRDLSLQPGLKSRNRPRKSKQAGTSTLAALVDNGGTTRNPAARVALAALFSRTLAEGLTEGGETAVFTAAASLAGAMDRTAALAALSGNVLAALAVEVTEPDPANPNRTRTRFVPGTSPLALAVLREQWAAKGAEMLRAVRPVLAAALALGRAKRQAAACSARLRAVKRSGANPAALAAFGSALGDLLAAKVAARERFRLVLAACPVPRPLLALALAPRLTA